MPDRRTNEDLRDRLTEIQADYERWARRTVAVLVVLAIFQLGLGALSVYLIDQNKQRQEEITDIAKGAKANATRARLESELNRVQVCSSGPNQSETCPKLFDRLSANISPEQRQRLACAVLAQLTSPKGEALHDAEGCQP